MMYICEHGELYEAHEFCAYCVWVSKSGTSVTIGSGEQPYYAPTLKEAIDYVSSLEKAAGGGWEGQADILIKKIKYWAKK